MRIDLNKDWYLVDKLTIPEREKLFILMEAANIPIFDGTRSHSAVNKFPYLNFREHKDEGRGYVVGTARPPEAINPINYQNQILDYEMLLDLIKERIQLNCKDTWKEKGEMTDI